MFKALHREFERADTDLYKLQKKPGFSRYLLIRSLGSNHLQELVKTQNGGVLPPGKLDLYEELFNSDIEEAKLIEYIRAQYPTVRAERIEQEIHLPHIISNFGEVRCGIRNDNLNDLTKELVRDKTIKTKEDLQEKVSSLLNGTINGYILWQYYNQVTNDLIEHIFNDHASVIPTLRKIKYVDFMVKVGEEIVPFDLKITHISDEYFDLFKKGLTEGDVPKTGDDYEIGQKSSEMELIKEHYKGVKAELNLPNYGSLKKPKLIDILRESRHPPTLEFLAKVTLDRAEMVNEIEKDLHSLEWWNYKFQGERLFKNNNRFFVFLTYKSSFDDARPLKGNLEEISQKVTARLNTICSGDFNTINYDYTKDKGLAGRYVVNSTSVLVTG